MLSITVTGILGHQFQIIFIIISASKQNLLDNTHANGKAIHGMTGCVNKRKTQTKPEGQMNKIHNTSSSQLKITAKIEVGATGSALKD